MNYIPYDKLSKKQRRTKDLKRRNTWGDVCPVTRRAKSKKTYCRASAKQETLRWSFNKQ